LAARAEGLDGHGRSLHLHRRAQQRKYQSRTIGTLMKLAPRPARLSLSVWLRLTAVCLFGPAIPVIAQGVADVCGCGRDGGPGAFRGGRGHSQPLGIGGLTPGGNGEGPGGGWGATTNVEAIGGTFTGTPELQPLIGGSGGGGGSGFGFEPACLGGGGGGGGGAILIKANGRITLQNFQIVADGGPGG